MPGLRIRLLGPFEVEVDGRPVMAFDLDRVRALLAYLAVEADRPHLRETLACLLWPEARDDSARGNLRQALYKLRLALGERPQPRFLQVSQQAIQLPPSEDIWIDAVQFTALVKSTQRHRHARLRECPECLARLRQATELYRGDFLAGLSLPDSLAFQEWAAVKQAELRDYMLNALSLLAETAWEAGDVEAAEALANRQLSLEPWSEQAHRLKMRTAWATGRRSAALQQYEVCRRRLRTELGIDPDPTTETLYRAIKAGSGMGSTRALPPAQPSTGLGVRGEEAGDSAETSPGSPAIDLGQVLQVVSGPPFLARERESVWLDARLAEALAGQGQVALVTGSSGSGKSALLDHFALRALEAHPSLVAVAAHFNMMANTGGLSAFVEILRLLAADITAFRAAPGATSEHLHRAQAALPDFISALTAEGPDLVGLLAGYDPEAIGGDPVSSHAARQLQALLAAPARPAPNPSQAALFDQLVRTLRIFARTHPLVIILGDMQWMGDDAAALLFYLATRLARSRILLIGSYRSGMRSQAGTQSQPLARVVDELRNRLGDIELDLDDADGRAFLDAYLATGGPVDGEFAEAIFARTQGHPLYTIELVRMLKAQAARLSSGPSALPAGADQRPDERHEEPQVTWDRLPARLEAVLAERLAGLPPDWQRTLEIASIQGSAFSAEVVARVQGVSPDDMIGRLSGPELASYRLVHADRITQGQGWRLSVYRFHNGFMRDVLYSRIDPVRRARWHAATAEALEDLVQADRKRMPGVLARHFQLGGNIAKALTYLEWAGHYALDVSAYRQAQQYFAEALDLVNALDESAERAEQELRLQVALDRTLRLATGWDAAERSTGVNRACELSAQAEDVELKVQVLYLQADLHTSRGETAEAIAAGERICELAAATGCGAHLALGKAAIGDASWFAGDYRRACEHLEPAIAYFEAHPDDSARVTAALDHAVVDHAYCALSYEALGDRSRATHHAEASLARAPRGHPSRLFALVFAGCLLRWLREDLDGVESAVDELTRAIGDLTLPPSLSPWIALWQGWRRARGGDAAGVEALEQVNAAWRSPPILFSLPLRTLLLVQGYLALGRGAEALKTVEEGIQACPPGGSAPLESELWRVRGELLMATVPQGGALSEALASLRRAQELTRASGAALLQARADRSLARVGEGHRE